VPLPPPDTCTWDASKGMNQIRPLPQ
jgi:hypothetical protein